MACPDGAKWALSNWFFFGCVGGSALLQMAVQNRGCVIKASVLILIV